jgi:hypothetical protein
MRLGASIGNALTTLLTRCSQRGAAGRRAVVVLAIVMVLFLSLYNLTDYPLTWFDEGSHLHVPKTLVRFGVYADYTVRVSGTTGRRSALVLRCCCPLQQCSGYLALAYFRLAW